LFLPSCRFGRLVRVPVHRHEVRPSFTSCLPSFNSFLPSVLRYLRFLPSFDNFTLLSSFLPFFLRYLHFLLSFLHFCPSRPSRPSVT
jgi:hypothetical protein